MATPRVCVLRAPGTNCDVETAHAFTSCGAQADRVHLFRVLEDPARLDDYQVLCIPGGFSYGDDIGAGVIFSSQLRGQLSETIGRFLAADKLALGICNGFQVLLKAGVLPGGSDGWPPAWTSDPEKHSPDATLTWNDNGRYTARWVRLKVLATKNVFLKGLDELDLPIAHAEGRLVPRTPQILSDWFANGQVGLCYRERPADGRETTLPRTIPAATDPLLPDPHNPNGSIANIAGLGDPSGRVLGLMPHPERFLHATQHPRWTRLGLRGDGEGLAVFRNAVEYFG
ncbi:MAG: phosphoribosylformylglycinamidine synthase subunit PurQ [Planctomycetaceae bacterium]